MFQKQYTKQKQNKQPTKENRKTKLEYQKIQILTKVQRMGGWDNSCENWCEMYGICLNSDSDITSVSACGYK